MDLQSDMLSLLGGQQPAQQPIQQAQSPAPLRNNNPGAISPGGSLASYPDLQTGLQSLDKTLQNYNKKGLNTLNDIINTYSPSASGNNTQSYINDASTRLGISPDTKIDLGNPVQRQLVASALILHENGPKGIFGQQQQAPQNSIDLTSDLSSVLENKGSQGNPVQQQQPMTPWNYSEIPDYQPDDLLKGAKSVASAVDVPLSIPSQAAGLAGYWMGRAQGMTPEEAQQQQQQVQNKIASKTTIGGLTGISNTPDYQNSFVNNALGYAGQGIGAISSQLSKVTGINQADIENAINTGLLTIPEAIRQIKAGTEEVPATTEAVTANPAVDPDAELKAQFAQKQAEARAKVQGRPVQIEEPVNTPPTDATPQEVQTAMVDNSTPVTETDSIQNSIENPEITPTENIEPSQNSSLSEDEIKTRKQILNDVGQLSARESAIIGDHANAATEAQMTKFNEPAGVQAANQFNHEHDSLSQHVENSINNLGGSVGLDENSLYKRGQSIALPFDKYEQWFDNKINNLYQQADDVAGSQPITDLSSTQELLKDPTFYNQALGLGNDKLLNAVNNQLKTFLEKNNNNLTVANVEDFRKFLNSMWTPENGSMLRKIKNSVDNDVFQSAGGNIYQEARQVFQLKHETLENPKGIFKLFDYNKNTPENRKTPFEKIPEQVLRLPTDQFQTLVTTLRSMPKDINPYGKIALNEIKSHFLNDLLDQGKSKDLNVRFWKNNNVNKLLLNNSRKLSILFSPKELDNIKLIKQAGDINSANPGYPGAAAQAANAVKRGLMSGLIHRAFTATGAGIGNFVGGPIGATVGAGIAEPKAVQLTEKLASRKFQKKLVNLKDIGK